jgi:putative Mg2+ transporter-C (MgtC) family protein
MRLPPLGGSLAEPARRMGDHIASELQPLLRVVIAAALAAALGWEREQARKAAGLRTHTLVGLAAALYTSLATLGAGELRQTSPDFRADPIRIVQAIALGVGFLGGGVITAETRHGDGHASGVTTAASIWSTAAIGLAAGLGFYALAVGATVLQLIVLHGLARLEPHDR